MLQRLVILITATLFFSGSFGAYSEANPSPRTAPHPSIDTAHKYFLKRVNEESCHISARALVACLEAIRMWMPLDGARAHPRKPQSLHEAYLNEKQRLIVAYAQSQKIMESGSKAFTQVQLKEALAALRRGGSEKDFNETLIRSLDTQLVLTKGLHHSVLFDVLEAPVASGMIKKSGVLLQALGDSVFIWVKPDSPAEKAGLRTGDLLLSVDHVIANAENYLNTVAALKNAVTQKEAFPLAVMRDGVHREFAVNPVQVRAQGPVQSEVRVSWSGKMARHIRVATFSKEKVCLKVIDALVESLNDQNLPVVFDLRGNTGGYLSQLSCLVSALNPGYNFEKKLVLNPSAESVLLQVREGKQDARHALQSLRPDVRDKLQSWPQVFSMSIWVDAQTGSAAEIFAAAMRERGGVTIVGRESRGKYSIQSVANGEYATIGYFRAHDARRGLIPDVVLREEESWLPRERDFKALYEGIFIK